jgi:hypothetical protein
VIQAYSAVYDNVDFDDYVRAVARLQTREMASRCLAEPEVFVSAVSVLLFDMSIWSATRPPARSVIASARTLPPVTSPHRCWSVRAKPIG